MRIFKSLLVTAIAGICSISAYAQGCGSPEACAEAQEGWNALVAKYAEAYPELAQELNDRIENKLAIDLEALEAIFKETAKTATREASGEIIQKLAAQVPALVGGSADLGPSNKTIIKAEGRNPDTPVYWKDETTPADFYCYYPYMQTVSDVTAVPFSVKADQSTLENYKASELLWGKFGK